MSSDTYINSIMELMKSSNTTENKSNVNIKNKSNVHNEYNEEYDCEEDDYGEDDYNDYDDNDRCICGRCPDCNQEIRRACVKYLNLPSNELNIAFREDNIKLADELSEFVDSRDIEYFIRDRETRIRTFIKGNSNGGNNMDDFVKNAVNLVVTRGALSITDNVEEIIRQKKESAKRTINSLVNENKVPFRITVNNANKGGKGYNKVKTFLRGAGKEDKMEDLMGDFHINKPFKVKLSKHTTAYGVIVRGKFNPIGREFRLILRGRNIEDKMYHWIKLREVLNTGFNRGYGHTLMKTEQTMSNGNENLLRIGVHGSVRSFEGTWNRFISAHKEDIYKYLSTWVNCETLFEKLNKSYKTGILLYGPTGTGKTTAIKAIAELLAYDIVNIDFSRDLRKQFESLDSNTIVVMEELETKIGKRVDITNNSNITYKESDKKLDLTGELLQLMDGSISYRGVIFIATTNDISKLDKSIIRAGRFDRIYNMEDFNEEMAEELCNKHRVNSKRVLKNMKFPACPAEIERRIHEVMMSEELEKIKIREIMKEISTK